MDEAYDTIVIGTGAAGLSSALYAGRYTMKTLALGEEFGGETARAGIIWNYPGVPGIDGYDLMKNMKKQAEEVGTSFFDGKVEQVVKDESGCFSIHTKNKTFLGNTVILAMGTKRRRLGLPNEGELSGKGMHYCVTCDGPLYSGKTIAIVGGGDGAVKGAALAAEYAKKIYIIARKNVLAAEPVNIEAIKKLSDKIVVLYETAVKEIIGTAMLEKIILSKEYNGSSELQLDGLFVEIGADPNTELVKDLGVVLDARGYVVVDNEMKTNIPGIFAAGDTVNFFGSFKQDITAAAMGSVAATSAYNYKKIHGDVCQIHYTPERKVTMFPV